MSYPRQKRRRLPCLDAGEGNDSVISRCSENGPQVAMPTYPSSPLPRVGPFFERVDQAKEALAMGGNVDELMPVHGRIVLDQARWELDNLLVAAPAEGEAVEVQHEHVDA